ELDAALAEGLRELLRGILVLLGDQAVEHLDHRDLAPEGVEDRRELAADDPAAEDGEPPWDLALREQAGGIDTELGVEPRERRKDREGPGCNDRRGERNFLFALDRQCVRVAERALSLHPPDAVRLEERRDAARHLVAHRLLPLVRGREVEAGVADGDAQPRGRPARPPGPVRPPHPCPPPGAARARAPAAAP